MHDTDYDKDYDKDYEDFIAENGEERHITMDWETAAASLYDGGWRAEDGEEFLSSDMGSEDDWEEICPYLEAFAEREGLM